MLKPDAYFTMITDITPNFLMKNDIKALILDVDNTIIFLDKKSFIGGIEDWISEIKKCNIKICIASNSIRKNVVENVALKLDIPYVFFSIKPFKKGLKKAIKIVNENPKNICEIGDQYFTDVIGAKKLNMFSILTKPLQEEKNFFVRIKRLFEKIIIKKYIK